LVLDITSFFIKYVKDQYINSMVKAEEKTDNKFTSKAICKLSGLKVEKKAPNIWYNGAPGGCPT